MRRVTLFLLLAVAAVACAVPGVGEADAALAPLERPEVRAFLPVDTPDGRELWLVEPILDAVSGRVVGAAAFFEGPGGELVRVCASDDPRVVDAECVTPRVPDDAVGTVMREDPLTVAIECVSASCLSWDPARWIDAFGEEPPSADGLPTTDR